METSFAARCRNRDCTSRLVMARTGRPRRFCSGRCQVAHWRWSRSEMNRHEWYTPNAVVEAAREAMGAIDLDPASCAEANEIVRAGAFYSRADNALARPWYGKVWLNPPFGRHAPLFVARLSAGEIEQACLLLPQNSLCTAWFAACDRSCPSEWCRSGVIAAITGMGRAVSRPGLAG